MHRTARPIRFLTICLFALMASACATAPQQTLQTDPGVLLAETRHALDAGDLATALVKLRQLQQHDPRNTDMLRLKARLHEALGETGAQHEVIALILQQQPDDPQLLVLMGLHALRGGQLLAAAEYLQQAVELDPAQWQAHNGLGIIADARRQYPEAQRNFNLALDVLPGHPVVTANLGWSRVLAGDLPEAEKLLRESALLAPHVATTQSNLAFCLALQGKYREAMETYLALYDEATAVNNIGFAATVRGDRNAAAEYLRQAIKLKPAFYGKASNNLVVLESLRD